MITSYNEIIKNYWNEESKRYREAAWERNLISNYDFIHTKEVLLKSLQPLKEEKILEIGCGPGLWTDLVAKRCARLTAIDISEKMIEKAKENSNQRNISFINCDLLDFVTDKKFNKIFSVRVIEYIRDKKKLFKKIRDLLILNGELIIITKTRNSLWDFYKRLKRIIKYYNSNCFNEVRQYSWYANPSIKQMRVLLENNNFLIINILPVIIRLPIFKQGNDEIPLISKKFEQLFLKIFNSFSGKISKLPFNLSFLFAESYLIHAIKAKNKVSN
ncbi:MAG: class I SAM-dependent methyltransferase [Candidatus Hodarchaeota archaeon]